ncbi:AAA family ATPase [Paenibacillus chartarius]|uniref:Nuclease SbcCD subunit C n=1 Tax=Paenibacillus chartarius TaxID=747481 RepID=A0ABV6DKM5_9BACL
MKYYLKSFLKENYANKNDAYLFILWSVFKNISTSTKLSDAIKKELSMLDYENFRFISKKDTATRIVEKMKQSNTDTLTKGKASRIEWIQIKNFKSFGSLSDEDKGVKIDLDLKKNIFFAPNGGGKTSLCEAFEYKLTGSIKEAVRRGVSLKEYIKRDSHKESIVIKFVDDDSTRDKFTESDNLFFHKCFIEKNRLQEFVLMGSKDTGTKEKDVIAVILGLQELDDLVSSFVQPASFKLASLKRNQITQELSDLDKLNQTYHVQKALLENQQKNERENCSRLLGFESGEIDQNILDSEINALNEKLGLLQKDLIVLEESKTTPVSPEKIIRYENLINRQLERLKELKEDFNDKALKVNYEQFYQVLSSLEKTDKLIESCPACGTPISQVLSHPYTKARVELENLKDISKLQSNLKRVEKRVKSRCYSMCVNFIKAYKENSKIISSNEYNFEETVSQLRDILSGKDKDKELNFVISAMSKLHNSKKEIMSYFELVNEYHQKHDLSRSIAEKQSEINFTRKKVEALKLSRANIVRNEEALTKLKENNSAYNEKVDKLKSKLINENNFNQFLDSVELAYKDFIKDLTLFKLEIESKQIHDIEQSVTNYYQNINKNDDDAEYITAVNFTLEGTSYKINVTLKDGTTRNSYACLSEGHLRSLGLSILLAVAEKNNVPFIIFDDVVNAIDSDHRANIIELLFNNDFLKKTQQIITTHDRLFWERFCNTYSQKVNRKDVDKMSYVINYTHTGSVLVQHNVGFEEKIQTALKYFDVRQALIYCRIWFETLVTEYLVERGETLTAKFHHKERNNLLKPTLESIYAAFSKYFPNDPDLSLIKNDLINWSAQNQEHHSFDENSYNFVHAKNSDEIEKIFVAIQKVSFKLFPKREMERLNKRKIQLIAQYESLVRKYENEDFRKKAPREVIQQHLIKVEDVRAELQKIDQLLNTLQNPA